MLNCLGNKSVERYIRHYADTPVCQVLKPAAKIESTESLSPSRERSEEQHATWGFRISSAYGAPIHETGFDPYPWVPVSWLPVFGCKANTVLHHKMRSISYVFSSALAGNRADHTYTQRRERKSPGGGPNTHLLILSLSFSLLLFPLLKPVFADFSLERERCTK